MDELCNSTDRDVVVRLACLGVASVAKVAVFLARHGDILKGWDGIGAGISRDTIRNLWLPMSSPSQFRDVVIHAQSYSGSPGKSAVDVLFQIAIGSLAKEVVILPISLYGRVIALLFAEDVSYGETGYQRLNDIADKVVSTFEQIVSNKAQTTLKRY